MVQTPTRPLTLAAFLAMPETQPASEFIDGQIIQKPMPQGEHKEQTVVVSPQESRSRTFEQSDAVLPVPDWAVGLELTVGELFGWLAG